MQASRNSELDSLLVAGSYEAAAKLAEKRLGLKPPPDGSLPPVVYGPKNVLNHLDAGEAWRLAGNTQRAIEHFDSVEEALKDVELQSAVMAGGKQVAAVLTNDSMLDYKPSPAEAILVNYRKALCFLEQQRPDDARIELNRADDRTRRSVERYSSEIAAAQAKAAGNAEQSYDNPKVQGAIAAKFPEMAQWAPYKEFIVPPATYLQALYLAHSPEASDRQKAADLFKRVIGIAGENPTIQKDALEASKGDLCPKNNCVWVLTEYGLGPVLEERRLDIPIITLRGAIAVSIALPALKSRTVSDLAPFRLVNDGTAVDLPVFATMDRVVETEFNKRFPGIVTRAVVSSTVKAIAQKEINNQNALAGLIANVAAIATTSADTRMWRSMPSRFALARIEKKKGGSSISLEAATGPIVIEVPANGSQLVHIDAPTGSVPPRIKVISL